MSELDKLAAKIGAGSEHILEVLHRQIPIETFWATVCSISALLLLVVSVIWAISILRRYKSGELIEYKEASERCIVEVIGAVIVGMFGLALCSAIYHLVNLILNPEYWMLRQIIK